MVMDSDYLKCEAVYPNSNFYQPCERAFAGVHGGGGAVNFAYCDGSVHVWNTTGDIRILAAMATIQGGESPSIP